MKCSEHRSRICAYCIVDIWLRATVWRLDWRYCVENFLPKEARP